MKTVIALLLLATAAHADNRACAPHDEQVKFLTEQWNESLLGTGISIKGQQMELWGDQKAGTWTFVLITKEGTACLMTAGAKLVLVPPGEPA